MEKINLQVITVKDALLAGLEKQIVKMDVDYSETVYTLPIADGVYVEMFKESECGALNIGNEYFEFYFNDEMAQVLTEWDRITPAELFGALYRNRWQLKEDITPLSA